MATRKVMLKYPEELIKEPVLFRMAKEYDVMPNIRRARVTDTVARPSPPSSDTAGRCDRRQRPSSARRAGGGSTVASVRIAGIPDHS